MYYFASIGIGVMIAVMVMINSIFAESAGYMISILIIHLVGLLCVTLLLTFRREEKKGKVPLYLYLGGVVGLALLFSNNYCFQILGASSTLALGIIGQSTASLLADSFGFLGVTKRQFELKKTLPLLVSLMGIVLLVDEWQLNFQVVILAFFTGMMVLLTMVLNSQLSLRIGVLKGTRVNYLSGLISTVVVMAIVQPDLSGALSVLTTISPVIILGGGVLGVMTVASINIVFPKIPTIYATLFIVTGQLAAGLIIDYFLLDMLSLQKLIGVLLILASASINLLIDKHASSKPLPATSAAS